MTPLERTRTAMKLGIPDQIPVQCQMSTGHILLNSNVDPVAYSSDSTTYADALWHMRGLYDFDGVLMHKPGREPGWLDDCERTETDDGVEFVFDDGGKVRVQPHEDPVYFPPSGFTPPEIETIDVENPLHGYYTGSYLKWHHHRGTHHYRTPEAIPEYWYDCIDRIKALSQGEYSLHGETRAPFDHALALLGSENLMVALLIEPDKVHQLMEWATQTAIAWSVAQVRRGCDAIKVSSPWVGSGFISREAYRTFVVPYETRLASAIRDAGGFVYTHTCGAISDRLEDMMSSSINGLECLDPPPLGDVALPDAIERTKGKVFIKGNIDSVNTLLKKDAAGVREDVQRTVQIGAPDGGYICSTACSVSPHVNPDHIKMLVEVARSYRY